MSLSENATLSRRRFLQITGATTLLSGFGLGLASTSSAEAFGLGGAERIDLADTGWKMWPDTEAGWKDDKIYLPGDFSLAKLPVNPPTGGWEKLAQQKSTEVTLPATVEQFHWGEFGFRPYGGDEYKYEPSSSDAVKNGTADADVQNGAYFGVSWWWKEIEIPASYRGKRILLHVRGARQRAEVYLNRKLVGYSVLEELPFQCDLTEAVRPGEKDQLAIRITNPGGRFDWVDRSSLQWGKVRFQKSHGFGGLDRGMVLSVHDAARISDLWILNTAEPRRVTALAEVENTGKSSLSGTVYFKVLDSNGVELAEKQLVANVKPGEKVKLSTDVYCPDAKLWDLETPNLYTLRVRFDAPKNQDTRERTFGFRWFAPEGVGVNAMFRLNGRRTRLYSAISWGFWPLNGLFPTPEFSLKEVQSAKQLNLNCLNFHRNPGKHDVLDAQDRLGLLRFMEPGGGALAAAVLSEPNSKVKEPDGTHQPEMSQDAAAFQKLYEEAKVLHMIRTFRSHPSLVGWTLQNEGRTDLTPELFAILKKMHAEDPSRCVVANDGFTMRSHQAWYEPYGESLRTSAMPGEPAPTDLTVNSAGGWWDDHQAAGSDVWIDSHWQGPEKYQWKSKNRGEIVQWGEMEGSAMLDNHATVLSQIAVHGGKSYDLKDHKEINDGYESFLSKWGFRKAFPSTDALYRALGKRCYDTWQQYMENARICDENDYLAISGWESTAIENHSGIVDVFRDFKADPSLIGDSLSTVYPVAKQRAMAYPLGEKAIFDLFFLNDSGKAVSGTLVFSLKSPSGKTIEIENFPVPTHVKDQLSYPIKTAVSSPVLSEEGEYVFNFVLTGNAASATQKRTIWVTKTDSALKKNVKAGLIGGSDELLNYLHKIGNLSVEPFTPSGQYDLLIASAEIPKASKEKFDPEAGYKQVEGTSAVPGLSPEVLKKVEQGTPLLVHALTDPYATRVAKDLANAGAFQFQAMVGRCRAPWMGAWYFNREHALFAGMPVDQALGVYYQVKGNPSNGWLVSGTDIEVITGFSRDHDRKVGAGTFVAPLGKGRIVMHRVPMMQKVLQQRFYCNAVNWLLQKQS